jgi:hypothetical protein
MSRRGTADTGFQIYYPLFIELHILKLKLRFGFEFSRVGNADVKYLDRYIIYLGQGTLRLHKFWTGDDDRAPHDHPWWFITIPFTTYHEIVEECSVHHCPPMTGDCQSMTGACVHQRQSTTRAWLPHFRPAHYRHRVLNPVRPFYTIVISGGVQREWGFWPRATEFISYTKWKQYVRDHYAARTIAPDHDVVQ